MNIEQFKVIDAFEKLIGTWKEAYQWKVSSFVAIKNPEGPKLLFGRVVFESVIAPQAILPYKFESEHIIAGREIIKIVADDIDVDIGKAKAGEMRVSGRTFFVSRNQETAFFVMFAPIYHPTVTTGPRLPTITIRGISRHELLSVKNFKPNEMFDWELKAANEPFDSIDELLNYLGLPSLFQMADSTTLEIVARTPAMILDASKIVAGQASIKCQVATALDVNKIKLGFKILRKGSTERSKRMGDQFEWSLDDDFRTGSVQIPVGDAPLIQCFLSYGDVALHQWWVLDQQKRLNHRHAIHEVFDEELKLIREFLFSPSKKDDRAFEHGVALLLNILGFSVSHHGIIKKLEDGPDIIAITPSEHIVVVECTTGLLDQDDKLAKLVRRTKLIKDKLATTGYGHSSVQPVIVSALTRSEVEADIEEAGKNGIAVVCKENLESLLNRVNLPPNPDGLFQEAVHLVPGVDESSLFGGE